MSARTLERFKTSRLVSTLVKSRAQQRQETHPLVVNDLGDDGELPLGRPVVDEDDAADLDEPLEGGGSFDGLERASENVRMRAFEWRRARARARRRERGGGQEPAAGRGEEATRPCGSTPEGRVDRTKPASLERERLEGDGWAKEE
jgi:hypothetical protein